MQNRYPLNQWQEIIGNCDTQLFLGCTDEMTAEFISNRTGEVSVAVSSQAKQLNTWRVSDYTPEYRLPVRLPEYVPEPEVFRLLHIYLRNAPV